MLDRTLFDMADAFMRVHACVDARASLEALIESQPRSALVTRARNRLREISRLPASACVE